MPNGIKCYDRSVNKLIVGYFKIFLKIKEIKRH